MQWLCNPGLAACLGPWAEQRRGDKLRAGSVQSDVVTSCPNDLPEKEGAFDDIAPTGTVTSSRTTRDIIAGQHGSRVCTWKDAVGIVVLVAVVGGLALLVNQLEDQLIAAALVIEGLGFAGHVVFLVLFMWVSTPFGYNWSTVAILVGFCYGWLGLIDVVVDTLIGGFFGYYLARYGIGKWTQRRIRKMSFSKRAYLLAAKSVIESGQAGILMILVLRFGPLPFGVLNGFLGATCTIRAPVYAATLVLGTLPGTIMMTNLGVVVRNLGSFQAATQSPSGRTNLIIQIVMVIVTFVLSLVFGRFLTIYVLPKWIAEDAVITLDTTDEMEVEVSVPSPQIEKQGVELKPTAKTLGGPCDKNALEP